MSETIKVGRKLIWAQNATETIYAHNKSGSSVAPGDVVILDTTNSTATEVAFTTTASADNKLVLGMVIHNIATDGYGQVQTKGPTDALKVDGTADIAVGDAIATYTTTKIGQIATSGKGGAFAIALEAYSTDDSLGVIDAWLTGSAARIDTSSLSATFASPTITGALSISAATTFTSTGLITIDGSASATDALTLTLGDILLSDGHLDIVEVNGTTNVFKIDHNGGVIASDNALIYLDDGGNIASGGNMVRLVPTGTPNAASILFEIVGAGKIGQAMYIDGDPTGIDLVHILCGGALTNGFAALGITNDGNLATGGALLNLTLSGTPNSAARVFEIDGQKDAIAMYIDTDAATEHAVHIIGSGNVANDKALLCVESNATALVAGSSLVRIMDSGAAAGAGATVYGLEIAMDGTNLEGLYVSAGKTVFAEDVTIETTKKLYFRDTSQYIYASADDKLDLVASTWVKVTGPFMVGVNDTGYDVTLFGATGGAQFFWDESADSLILNASKLAEHRVKLTAKTGDYTVVEADSGTWFTTEGAAGNVNFTLPTSLKDGLIYHFIAAEDYILKVTAAANTMILYNDVAATSIAFATASEKVGGSFTVICDGTKYMVFVGLADKAQTLTTTT